MTSDPMLTSAILKAYKNTNAHFYPWTSMVMIMLIKTHYQLKDSCKTMHWGKKDTCVWVFSQCVCGGLSMPSYALCPLIHHSPETGLHSNEATRADTHTHKHTHTHTHTHAHTRTHTHTRAHTHTHTPCLNLQYCTPGGQQPQAP